MTHAAAVVTVRPLRADAASHVFGILTPGFRQEQQRTEKIRRAEASRHPAGAGYAEVLQTHPTQPRPEHKPQPEGHADQAHAPGALFRRGDVGDSGLGHRQIGPEESRQHPRGEKHGQRDMPVQPGSQREHHIRPRRPQGPDQHWPPAPDPVAPPAPQRGEHELHQRIDRHDRPDLPAAGVLVVRIDRQDRDDHAKADQIEKYGEENDTEDGALACRGDGGGVGHECGVCGV